MQQENTQVFNEAQQTWVTRSLNFIPPFLTRPEYLYNRSQIGRRIWHQLYKGNPVEEVMLPWGAPIFIGPDDLIGDAIWKMGVFDLIVAEALMRLTDPGELALDVGANIGVMSSVLAGAVGPKGRVISFEPLPSLVTKFRENVDLWRDRLGWSQVSVVPTALSSEEGEAVLTMPTGFAANRGIATLETGLPGEKITIATATLDASLASDEFVGTMKIDVEGHEHSVLQGSDELLSTGRIRDIVFEENNEYPSAATSVLESHGYKIFGLKKGLLGPQLIAPTVSKKSGETPNYLATRDPSRAIERLTATGWCAYKKKEPPR